MNIENSTQEPKAAALRKVVIKKPSIRALKAVQLVAKGSSKAAALRKAGYSEAVATQPHKVFKSKSLADIMEKFLPDKMLLKVHVEGLNAERYVENAGDIPDYAVRHKYLETAYKIKGHMKGENGGGGDTEINFVSIRNKYA